MLREDTRTAILELSKLGHGIRRIAREMKVSRQSVRLVLEAGSAEVPLVQRSAMAEPLRDRIIELLAECKGNLVRVHEDLVKEGATLSYQALTAFCRKHWIGRSPPTPAGKYTFAPGAEMQHDTSPHDIPFVSGKRPGQTASLVFCFSRMIYFQMYPQFRRFECKLFLVDAMRYFGGACLTAKVDNSHVVVLRGTGASMVPVPEMAALADHLGFAFSAHEKGDANRSARVERPFHYIENNFLAGRKFESWAHANAEAVAWCDRDNARFRRPLMASPRELFATERLILKPLPAWIPDPYLLHHRLVDLEGCVSVATNRYSAPPALIGRRVEVRETKARIEVFDGPRIVATHDRVIDQSWKRVIDPAHRPPRETKAGDRRPVDERALLDIVPQLAAYVQQLKQRFRGNSTLAIRRLLMLVREYPREAVLFALAEAERYGMYEVHRIEDMVLRRIATDFFVLDDHPSEPDPHDG